MSLSSSYSNIQPFVFGSFNYSCSQLGLAVCPLLGSSSLAIVDPVCYSRTIQINDQIIFQPAVLVLNLIALAMLALMFFNIRQKYTAVGRLEILHFFGIYSVAVVLEFFLVGGFIPMASQAYTVFTAIYMSLIVSSIWCLFANGFVAFQWIEDGSLMSLWSIRISSFLVGILTFFFAMGTFNEVAGFSKALPTPLFFIYYVFTGALVLIYTGMQIVLIVNTLDDRWPMGDIFIGLLFFTLGKIFEYAVAPQICLATQHYVDGMFFGNAFSLLAVMMVYKYWNSITKEDLEFSLGGKAHVWELKQSLLTNQ